MKKKGRWKFHQLPHKALLIPRKNTINTTCGYCTKANYVPRDSQFEQGKEYKA